MLANDTGKYKDHTTTLLKMLKVVWLYNDVVIGLFRHTYKNTQRLKLLHWDGLSCARSMYMYLKHK